MATAIQVNGKTIYNITNGGGGAISFTGGEDEDASVGTGKVYRDVMALDPDSSSETNLISAINGSNYLKVLEMKSNLQQQETQNDLLGKLVDNLKASGLVSTEILLQHETNLQVNAEILNNLISLNDNIKSLVSATKNQSFSLDTSNIERVLNSGVENQIITNNKIVEGIESQKQVNGKQFDKLNQELEKNIFIDGKNLNSLELQDMKNKELYTSASDENNFSLNDGLGIVEDLLTDGFDLDSNPLTMFLNDVKEEFEKESKEIEVKYNIKGVK